MRTPTFIPPWSTLLPIIGVVFLLVTASQTPGLTSVAAVSLLFDLPLSLGLDALDMALLALTLLTATLTLSTGKTTLLQGVVHLVIFAAYLFLSFVP